MSNFDVQADRFDARAGLPEKSCRRIADAVVATAGLRGSISMLSVQLG
jgi:hypothetical protein